MKIQSIFKFFIISILIAMLSQMAIADVIPPNPEYFSLPSEQRLAKRLCDEKYDTYWKSKKNHPYMDISSPEPLGGIYICFANPPKPWVAEIKQSDDSWHTIYDGGKNGFMHEYFPLNGETELRISIKDNAAPLEVAEIFLLDDGPIPDFVQTWRPTVDKAELMLITAHPDDEVLFFGGLLPYYGGELEKDVLAVVMATGARVRKHEYLNSLWECGVKNYPILGGFYDQYFYNLKEAYERWGKRRSHEFITSLFRQYRPEVVVTHDVNGEYGHGAHRLCADAVVASIDKAKDSSIYEESFLEHGTWEVKKVYLHLSKENPITMDWDIPLSSHGNKTGFQVAQDAYKLHLSQQRYSFIVEPLGSRYSSYDFGLVFSTVGKDLLKNDFLENIYD